MFFACTCTGLVMRGKYWGPLIGWFGVMFFCQMFLIYFSWKRLEDFGRWICSYVTKDILYDQTTVTFLFCRYLNNITFCSLVLKIVSYWYDFFLETLFLTKNEISFHFVWTLLKTWNYTSFQCSFFSNRFRFCWWFKSSKHSLVLQWSWISGR